MTFPDTPGSSVTAEAVPLDALPWGVWVLDAQRVLRSLNQQAAHWCGAAPGSLVGRSLSATEAASSVLAALHQLLQAGEGASHEMRLLPSEHWIALTCTRQADGWAVYGQDITPQKRREQQYQTLADNTPDALTRWGPDLRLRYANSAFVDKVGGVLTDLLGRTNREMGQPEDVAGPYMAALQRVFDTGQAQEHFNAVPTPHGEVYHYSRLVPEPHDGRVETVLGIARDITALKQTEAEALCLRDELAQRATDKYHALFQTMDQGFCVVEMVFDESGQQAVDFRYLELNPMIARLWGMPAITPGRTGRELLPDLEPFWFDTYGRVALTGESVRVEHYVPQLGRWYDVHAFRTGPLGAHQVAVLFNDVTERKQTEAQLRDAAEADAFRLRLADALGPLANPVNIQEAVTHLTRQHFGADRCYYCEMDEGLAIIRRDAAAAGLPSVAGTYPLADFALLQAVIEAGRPFIVRDVRQDATVDEGLRQLCVQLQVISYLNVPVLKNGQPAGVLCLVQSEPRDWTVTETILAAEVAERTWAAVERARAEAALAASEQRLRALIANLPGAAVFIVNRELRYQLAEGEALRRAGYEPADFLGRTVREMAPPGQGPTYQGAYQKALAGRAFEKEHEQGGRFFLTRGVPLTGPAGEVATVLAVSYDFTKHRQAEEALQASEAKYRTLFERMDQGFGTAEVLAPDEPSGMAADFRWLDVNPQFERLTGLNRADLLSGRTAREILPNLEAFWFEHYGRVAATGEPVRFEQYEPAIGRWLDVYAFAVGEPGARRIAVLFTDTSERKRAEEALRHAEELHLEQLEQRVARRTQQLQASRDLLQSVFDTNLIAMSVLQAVRDEGGTIQDFRLVLVSQELARETGRTELVGKLYAHEYPGIRDVGIFDLIVHTVETGQPQGMEYYYPHEGFDKWYECQFVKLGDGVVATNLDITERKRAEQELLLNLHLLKQAEAVAGLGSWDYNRLAREFLWSDGMYQICGLPLGQPVTPDIYLQLVTDEDRPHAEQLLRYLATGHGSFEETLRLRVGEQVKIVYIKAVVLRDEAGRPMRVLGVGLDISELQRLEADNLRLRLTQQHALFEAVQAAQEAERKRMAESLHNGIGQLLYATKLRLDQLHAHVPHTAPALVAARRDADQLLAEAIRQTRVLSHELVPMVLEEFGLAAALQDIGWKMSTPQLRFTCQVLFDKDAASITSSLQLALYRMVQELALNVVKHARGATAATLELETMPGWVLLRAEDNGLGFAPGSAAAGLGLRSIRDRVELLGGILEAGTSGGAYVRLRIPLTPPI